MADVAVAIENAVATVTLNRPQLRNAVKLQMWRDVARIFSELARDDRVRAVLLTGAGGNFSVGADITEFAMVRATAEQANEYEVAVDASSQAIAEIAKPTIAVISGYCLGGGCHLAMACDFRFADHSAVFGIPAARLSIVYGLRSTQRLLSLVGLTAAKRILFVAERFDAAKALSLGMADDVSGDAASAALALAATMADNAPLSISGAKAMLDGLSMGLGAFEEATAQGLIDRAADSADYAEGRRAFAEKRPPRFRGH